MSSFCQAILSLYKRIYRRLNRWLRTFLVNWSKKKVTKKLDYDNIDNVLIIAPHPDDEVFGCGMLINEMCKREKTINVIILSKGEASLPESVVSKKDLISVRRSLAEKALTNLGLDVAKNLTILDFPDSKFAETPQDMIDDLSERITALSPDCVFVATPLESTREHPIGTKIVMSLLENTKIQVYYFCVWFYFKIPLKKLVGIDFSKAYYTEGDSMAKQKSMDIYMDARTPSGYQYSCNLSSYFLRYVGGDREIYFKAD